MAIAKIVFWSGSGNTEAMADLLAEGVREAGAEAEVIPVSEADSDDLAAQNAFALGCPSMGVEQLEEDEMEPFMAELDGKISGKKAALFGSYGWGEQEWMRDWEKRVGEDGAEVILGEGVTVLGEPDEETAEKLKALGRELAGSL